MSRDENLLTPELRAKLLQLKIITVNNGLVFGTDWLITCTARFIHEQVVLFLQGRCDLKLQNTIRKSLRMPEIDELDNRVVTWTIAKSKHIIVPGYIEHAFAFDFCILKGKKATYNPKVSVDEDEIPDYQEIGMLAEGIELKWGGRFSPPDFCHIEL